MAAGRGRSVDVEGVADTACKVSRRPGKWQREESMGWREGDLNSCSSLEKEAACKQLLMQDRLWINSLQSPRNYMNSFLYCWRLQEVTPAYWGCEIPQKQYKAFHTRAEQLKCQVYNRSWSKHINLQRQVKQGYIFLLETYKRNIPCNYLDFSTLGAKGEGDAKVNERYAVLFCKKSQWILKQFFLVKPKLLQFWEQLRCPGAIVQWFVSWKKPITLF